MGYSYRNNGAITDYWPDNTDTVMYVGLDATLTDLTNQAREYFGDRLGPDDEIVVGAENVHTSCLTYDQYDPSDYTLFVTLTLVKGWK